MAGLKTQSFKFHFLKFFPGYKYINNQIFEIPNFESPSCCSKQTSKFLFKRKSHAKEKLFMASESIHYDPAFCVVAVFTAICAVASAEVHVSVTASTDNWFVDFAPLNTTRERGHVFFLYIKPLTRLRRSPEFSSRINTYDFTGETKVFLPRQTHNPPPLIIPAVVPTDFFVLVRSSDFEVSCHESRDSPPSDERVGSVSLCQLSFRVLNPVQVSETNLIFPRRKPKAPSKIIFFLETLQTPANTYTNFRFKLRLKLTSFDDEFHSDRAAKQPELIFVVIDCCPFKTTAQLRSPLQYNNKRLVSLGVFCITRYPLIRLAAQLAFMTSLGVFCISLFLLTQSEYQLALLPTRLIIAGFVWWINSAVPSFTYIWATPNVILIEFVFLSILFSLHHKLIHTTAISPLTLYLLTQLDDTYLLFKFVFLSLSYFFILIISTFSISYFLERSSNLQVCQILLKLPYDSGHHLYWLSFIISVSKLIIFVLYMSPTCLQFLFKTSLYISHISKAAELLGGGAPQSQ